MPGPHNIRRRNLETYFQTHGVEIAAMLEMDAMIGTLEFVARTDWIAVLPSLISVNDIAKGDLVVSGLRSWSQRHAEPIAVPPGRSGWVQSNFLMRNCAMLSRSLTVEGSITLRYRVGGSLGSEVVSVAAAQILLTRGPRHPSVPINQVG